MGYSDNDDDYLLAFFSTDYLEVNAVSLGDKLDICGSHCESPNFFYCHLVKTGGDLEKIMTDLEEVYSSLGSKEQAIDDPVVGMYCTAKFTGTSMISLLCNVQVNFNHSPTRGSPLMSKIIWH